MYSCPAACAVVDSYSEDSEEEEKTGHAKADLVDRRVANKSFAVLSCIHLLTQFIVEWDLIENKKDKKYIN